MTRRRGLAGTGTKPLVLLAEPDLLAAELWELEFRTHGFEVVLSRTVEEAQDAAGDRVPELTVIDLVICGGRGVDLCRHLRQRHTAPLLVVSNDPTDTDNALDAGADAFLTKPLRWGALAEAARNLICERAWAESTRSLTWPSGDGPGGFRLSLLPAEAERRVAELERERERLASRVQELETRVQGLVVANTDLDRFAAEVAHDLAQPLLTTGGYLVILDFQAGDSLDEAARASLQAAMDSVTRMNATLRALREYSRVGACETPSTAVDLGEVVRAVIDDLSPTLRSSDAEVVLGELPVLEGDPALLGRMFSNLVANGVKYSRPEVPPRIAITAERRRSRWHIHVDDNGIGIPADRREEVFEAFARLPETADRPGTGLGLAIARRVAERHGGAIRADGAPGGGTRFVVDLPAAEMLN